MKLNLSQYPRAIAQASQAVNEIEHQLAAMRLHLARLASNADKISAFEANLKNDNQRRARRFEILQANHEYRQACDAINRLKQNSYSFWQTGYQFLSLLQKHYPFLE